MAKDPTKKWMIAIVVSVALFAGVMLIASFQERASSSVALQAGEDSLVGQGFLQDALCKNKLNTCCKEGNPAWFQPACQPNQNYLKNKCGLNPLDVADYTQRCQALQEDEGEQGGEGEGQQAFGVVGELTAEETDESDDWHNPDDSYVRSQYVLGNIQIVYNDHLRPMEISDEEYITNNNYWSENREGKSINSFIVSSSKFKKNLRICVPSNRVVKDMISCSFTTYKRDKVGEYDQYASGNLNTLYTHDSTGQYYACGMVALEEGRGIYKVTARCTTEYSGLNYETSPTSGIIIGYYKTTTCNDYGDAGTEDCD